MIKSVDSTSASMRAHTAFINTNVFGVSTSCIINVTTGAAVEPYVYIYNGGGFSREEYSSSVHTFFEIYKIS